MPVIKASKSILQNKKLLILLNCSFWTLMWLIAIWNSYMWAETTKGTFEWKNLFLWSFPHNLTLLILSFGVFKIYFTVGKNRDKIFFLKHFVLSVITGFVYRIVFALILTISVRWINTSDTIFITDLSNNLSRGSYFGTSGLLLYWFIFLVIFALDTYEKYKNQQLSILALKNKHQEAKMQALRMQIQPHFLFNAFNVIGMKAREKKHHKVVDMIANLSDILRYSLNLDHHEMTTLDKEISLIKKYLKIESIRFRDRLTSSIQIEDKIAKTLVPGFILQPIIENCFKHGISQCISNATLEINAIQSGNSVKIMIFNSGPQLAENWILEKNLGIGLKNTIERLNQHYPNNFSFKLHNDRTDGVTTELTFPIHHE